MAPQPGIFAIPPYAAPAHKSRTANYDISEMGIAYQHHQIAGPSRVHATVPGGAIVDDGRKDKRRKELSGKLGKEMNDRRDDGRHFSENIQLLHNMALQLSTRPEAHPLYNLRLYPISLERSAILSQLEAEEKHALDCAQVAYDEERGKVEEEWKRGRERVRERLLEGVEERRRRAREEKEGEGIVGDASMDSHSRPPITRKLRNKMGTSPPPTPGAVGSTLTTGTGVSSLPITTGPFLNPHSLSVDELPSPFPLPLTATTAPNGGFNSGSGGTGAGGATGRRRPKGGGGHQNQAIGGLGKSLTMLCGSKESEIESDLGEIRRGNKRRRATAVTNSSGDKIR